MDDRQAGGDDRPDPFEAERPRLLGLAYRLVGGRSDAEDVVQEAWLRWAAADTTAIVNPGAWLTTVTTRLALDRIRQVERRRETYVGPWLPEPISTDRTPEQHSELAESLTLGFLVVLDSLAPVERAVLLLADVFAEPYAVIAGAVGKSEGACRQIATRARRKVRVAVAARGGRQTGTEPAPAALLAELMSAILAGDEAAVIKLVDPDVVLITDGGASRHAARRPVMGSFRVNRFLANVAKRLGVVPVRVSVVNASPALVLDDPAGKLVLTGELRAGVVSRLYVQMNPEKGADLDRPVELY
jgi:RNA polymerase sigma-70 factor (ECF subfamily)